MVLIASFLILSNNKKGHFTPKWHPDLCQLETVWDCFWVNRPDFAWSRGSKSPIISKRYIFNEAHPMWFHILSRKMKENSWMIAKDPFSNCLNSPFSLSVDSVIPSDTDKDLHHIDSLELCLYLHLCLYLYLLLSVNSDITSEHTVLQQLDCHNYNIYSLSIWVFQ